MRAHRDQEYKPSCISRSCNSHRMHLFAPVLVTEADSLIGERQRAPRDLATPSTPARLPQRLHGTECPAASAPRVIRQAVVVQENVVVGCGSSHNVAMTLAPLVPHGEALRRAVAWLAERGEWTVQRVEEACERFDLSRRPTRSSCCASFGSAAGPPPGAVGSAPDPEMSCKESLCQDEPTCVLRCAFQLNNRGTLVRTQATRGSVRDRRRRRAGRGSRFFGTACERCRDERCANGRATAMASGRHVDVSPRRLEPWPAIRGGTNPS